MLVHFSIQYRLDDNSDALLHNLIDCTGDAERPHFAVFLRNVFTPDWFRLIVTHSRLDFHYNLCQWFFKVRPDGVIISSFGFSAFVALELVDCCDNCGLRFCYFQKPLESIDCSFV